MAAEVIRAALPARSQRRRSASLVAGGPMGSCSRWGDPNGVTLGDWFGVGSPTQCRNVYGFSTGDYEWKWMICFNIWPRKGNAIYKLVIIVNWSLSTTADSCKWFLQRLVVFNCRLWRTDELVMLMGNLSSSLVPFSMSKGLSFGAQCINYN